MPLAGTAHYQFPSTPYTTQDFKFTWYNGARKPSVDLLLGEKDSKRANPKPMTKLPDQGSVFVGEKGNMLLEHVAGPRFFPYDQFVGTKKPDLKNVDHYHQWVNAALGTTEASAPFSYAAPLTEGVLLGLVASYFPNEKLKWDAEKMAFNDNDKANSRLRRTYRKGWEVEGLS